MKERDFVVVLNDAHGNERHYYIKAVTPSDAKDEAQADWESEMDTYPRLVTITERNRR